MKYIRIISPIVLLLVVCLQAWDILWLTNKVKDRDSELNFSNVLIVMLLQQCTEAQDFRNGKENHVHLRQLRN